MLSFKTTVESDPDILMFRLMWKGMGRGREMGQGGGGRGRGEMRQRDKERDMKREERGWRGREKDRGRELLISN